MYGVRIAHAAWGRSHPKDLSGILEASERLNRNYDSRELDRRGFCCGFSGLRAAHRLKPMGGHLRDAATALRQLPTAFKHFNETCSHLSLKMRPTRAFRRHHADRPRRATVQEAVLHYEWDRFVPRSAAATVLSAQRLKHPFRIRLRQTTLAAFHFVRCLKRIVYLDILPALSGGACRAPGHP